ncbi:hypothetical protein ACOJR9_16420 [Alteromonas sp. A081]|uniref:hypothetical protein n=1 Tax=Alteromonas sp. A081 TaxID=3410269 RepID=UPI003B985B44
MIALTLTTLVASTAYATGLPETHPHVLVIDSYHGKYPWVSSYRKGLESILQPTYTVRYFEMDTKRLPLTEFAQQSRRALDKIEQLSPEHVFLADDNAIRLLGPTLIERDIPFTYFGVNTNPRLYGIPTSEKVNGVLERLLIKRAVLVAKKLLPIKKGLVLFDNGHTSQAIFQHTFNREEHQEFGGVSITVKCITSLSDWQSTILMAEQEGFDAIFVGLYQSLKNEDGTAVPEEDAISWISANATIPPFALWDYAVGKEKVIGGLVISGVEQGTAAAQLFLNTKLFSDSVVSDNNLPAVNYSSIILYSRSQLDKWALTPSTEAFYPAQYVE